MTDITHTIQVEGLRKSFKEVKVLEGIDLFVQQGTMLALLGPNGAGKTTTVRILSTLLKPDAGTVRIQGYDVIREPQKVRGIIGLTGQYAAVDEYLTGRENLEMMGRLYHLGREKSRKRADELLQQFDLVEAGNRTVKTYSGGMRRRIDLAASLIASPPILFLDEPTTGLDPRSRLAIWDVIDQLRDNGTTILLTTQYLEEADKLADKIAVIDRGKVIASGTADELKSGVGQERIELTIDAVSNFDEAVRVIGGKTLRVHKENRSISVATDGSVRELKRVLDALFAAQIEIDNMSVHKPTLDDVFLQLTGHQAETSAMESAS